MQFSEVIIIEVELLAFLLAFNKLDACFLVVANSLLEEIRLTLEGNHIHPLEGVFDVEVLRHSQRE